MLYNIGHARIKRDCLATELLPVSRSYEPVIARYVSFMQAAVPRNPFEERFVIAARFMHSPAPSRVILPVFFLRW